MTHTNAPPEVEVSIPSASTPGLSRYPHQFQTGVNQCPKLILISISVEEQSGHSSLLSLADLVIVHKYYEVLRNVKL